MSNTPRADAQYAELSALLDDGEISYDDALISMRDKSIELELENAKLAELLAVAIWHMDMLDLGDVAFFERHGFNVSEVMPRTRAAIAKVKGGVS